MNALTMFLSIWVMSALGAVLLIRGACHRVEHATSRTQDDVSLAARELARASNRVRH
ncbi:hypothetical protein BGLT_06441 [Caballeronia glathei]|jgi:hypothetical protein|uniref:hypothetical protein n=1 Tax=Caballeronia glathei TaxID=60547 RepID=UPI00050378ED|nr:hypothetical protein [Caballeronia glathei]CDY77528.1 hypothetical protein BGLT_06441 [Caballeronia glathei]